MGRDILDSTRSLAFLEKPFSAEGLVAKVREVLGHKRRLVVGGW